MKYLPGHKVKKTILVISDLHLSAGVTIDNKRNDLEDFHSDRELVEFIEFFSSGEFLNNSVELVINGDFLDFLAVPYVPFHEDEFWSQEAALYKLKIIFQSHPEVFLAMEKFLRLPDKQITYVLGNHDAEMVFEVLQEEFLSYFSPAARSNLKIRNFSFSEYVPIPGIMIKHGHEYELAHHVSQNDCIITDEENRKYFLPPWGSYYVTRVINRFKRERKYINSVRPIRKFLIHGLVYDSFFTIRFMLASFFYFIMVRFIFIFREGTGLKNIWKYLKSELHLFLDFESITEEFLLERNDIKALIVGHSHDPIFRVYPHGPTFINTGTWTKMINLDFDKRSKDSLLTFAQVDVLEFEKKGEIEENIVLNLNVWRGSGILPYEIFN